MDTKRGGQGWDELGDGGWHVCAVGAVCDYQEPTVQLGQLCQVLCGDLDGKEIQKRGHVYTYS